MKLRFEDILEYAEPMELPVEPISPDSQERIRAMTMKKASIEASDGKKVRKPLRFVVAAAAAVAVLGITAGAVGYSLHSAARTDLGISADIPEYTEYEEAAPSAVVSVAPVQDKAVPGRLLGGPVQLVSTLCSGNEMVAYISVPGVTEEMEAPLENGDIWDIGSVEPSQSGMSFGVKQTDYDPETQTALVKLHVIGVPEDAETLSVEILYRVWNDEPDATFTLYDPLEIPITESTSLHADINKTVTHPNMETFTAELQRVDVYAGYVSVAIQTPSYEELMEALGDDAWTVLGETVYGEPAENELDALHDYDCLIDMMMNPYEQMTIDPDSPKSPNYIMEGATLNLSDGSELVLADLDRVYAAEWAFTGASLDEAFETGQWSFELALSNALNLTEIESITIGGVTYPLT